jgi:hypothetical protein
MNIRDQRKLFARAIRSGVNQNVDKRLWGLQFAKALEDANPKWYDGRNIADRSLNAAWNFCDYYFDAIGHGFDDCAGIPIERAAIKLQELKTTLEQGEEIEDEEILAFSDWSK